MISRIVCYITLPYNPSFKTDGHWPMQHSNIIIQEAQTVSNTVSMPEVDARYRPSHA